jgi:6-phosphogluconolactonase (cycloisomerase 2 family)
MKFNTINRTAKATVLSLAIGLGSIACSRDYTSDYVYAVSNTTGQVSGFAVDYQSGVLTQLPGSPFVSNLQNPTSVISAPNGKTIYVIGGSFNANVEVMSIGYDGKLYGQATPSLSLPSQPAVTYPTAAATDQTGSYLYVTYTYQGGFTPVSPGRGGITIFPINGTNTSTPGTLGTPTNIDLGNNPIAVAVSAPTCSLTPTLPSSVTGLTSPTCIVLGSGSTTNNGYPNVFVYVVDAEIASGKPTILGFAQNPSNGNLVPLSGTNMTTFQGFAAGVSPSAIAIDPTGKFVYVTDKQQNEIFGYQIANNTTGNLTPLVSSPFATGQYPLAITIEPRGKYVYVANYNSQTVSSYALNLGDGSLGATAGSGFTTTAGPTCVTVESALGIYLYTSNYLDGNISGGQLSPNTGALSAVANSFFPTIGQPICLTSVANGSHAVQVVNP